MPQFKTVDLVVDYENASEFDKINVWQPQITYKISVDKCNQVMPLEN